MATNKTEKAAEEATKRATHYTDLARKFVTCKMNCTRMEYNPTKILKLLGSNFADIDTLREEFINEKIRMDKEGRHDFNQYYTPDISAILDELIENVKKNYNSKMAIWSVECTIGHIIVNALKNEPLFRNFNWSNYNMLRENELTNLFSEFDSDFRGDIVKCHKVGGKYIVIETERYPFDYDKQRYKTREPKEKQFYSTEVRKGKLYLTSTMFHSFEAALFHTMAPSQYSAMTILFEAANKED